MQSFLRVLRIFSARFSGSQLFSYQLKLWDFLADPISRCTQSFWSHPLWLLGGTLGVLGVSQPQFALKFHQYLSSRSLAKLPTQTLGKALEELQEFAVLWGLRWFHPKETLRKFIFRAGFPCCIEPGLREGWSSTVTAAR